VSSPSPDEDFQPTAAAMEIMDRLNPVQLYLAEARQQGKLDPNPSPQCRVCRDELLRTLVNKMLARSFTIEDILDVLESHNRTLKYNRRVTYDSVRRHRINHFPVQVPASAVMRKLVEKRAVEAGVDVDNASGMLVNAMSYLEAMMHRGFERVSDPMVLISAEEGMKAAVKLHELQRKDEGMMDRARMLAEMNRIIELVRTYVPQDRWPALQAALKGEPAVIEGEIAKPDTKIRMADIDDTPDEEDEK
jgi:hypothetical protein